MRAHGGTPPDFWGDYGQIVRVLGALMVVVVLGTAFLVVRSKQSARAEIDEYCTVYDQTHDQIAGALSDATSTTAAPGTTTVGTTVDPGTTIAPAAETTTTVAETTTTVATTDGSTPGSTPGSVPTPPTTADPVADVTRRVVEVAEKRAAVGPPKIRAAWAELAKVLKENKQSTASQNAVQADRALVSDFAKTECGRDPADF